MKLTPAERRLFLMGVEVGYLAAEKGMNIQWAFEDANKRMADAEKELEKKKRKEDIQNDL